MNKILFISSRESDYLQDLIYTGLCQKWGCGNILVDPWKWSYYWPRKEYPRNLGLPENARRQFLGRVFRHFQESSSRDWSQISLVVVASTKVDTFLRYKEIQKEIPSSIPIVFLDGGDWPEIAGDLLRLKAPTLFKEISQVRPFDFIFKREMIIGKDYGEWQKKQIIAPLPFPVPTQKIPKAHLNSHDRMNEYFKYNVTFWAVESDAIRTKALELIENEFDCRDNGTTRNQVFKKYKRKGLFYLEELSKSRVTLNFRGVGWDTLRFWEVLGMGGFLISQKPQIQIPDSFIDKHEIIYCKDDLSDLKDLCQFYLTHENERQKIALAGQKKSSQFHSELARVEFMFKELQRSKVFSL